MEEAADVTLVDMEAGLEHLSRSGGTLAYADVLLVIMEPTRKSIMMGARTKALAEELGIPMTFGVGNKAAPGDQAFFDEVASELGLALAGVIPHDAEVIEADRSGIPLSRTGGSAVRAAVADIVRFVDEAMTLTV